MLCTNGHHIGLVYQDRDSPDELGVAEVRLTTKLAACMEEIKSCSLSVDIISTEGDRMTILGDEDRVPSSSAIFHFPGT